MLIKDCYITAIISNSDITCTTLSLINNTACTGQLLQGAVTDIIPACFIIKSKRNITSSNACPACSILSINACISSISSCHITVQATTFIRQANIDYTIVSCVNIACNFYSIAACCLLINIYVNRTSTGSIYITCNAATCKLHAAISHSQCIIFTGININQAVNLNCRTSTIDSKSIFTAQQTFVVDNNLSTIFSQQRFILSRNIQLINIVYLNSYSICLNRICARIQAHALIVELQL